MGRGPCEAWWRGPAAWQETMTEGFLAGQSGQCQISRLGPRQGPGFPRPDAATKGLARLGRRRGLGRLAFARLQPRRQRFRALHLDSNLAVIQLDVEPDTDEISILPADNCRSPKRPAVQPDLCSDGKDHSALQPGPGGRKVEQLDGMPRPVDVDESRQGHDDARMTATLLGSSTSVSGLSERGHDSP